MGVPLAATIMLSKSSVWSLKATLLSPVLSKSQNRRPGIPFGNGTHPSLLPSQCSDDFLHHIHAGHYVGPAHVPGSVSCGLAGAQTQQVLSF